MIIIKKSRIEKAEEGILRRKEKIDEVGQNKRLFKGKGEREGRNQGEKEGRGSEER